MNRISCVCSFRSVFLTLGIVVLSASGCSSLGSSGKKGHGSSWLGDDQTGNVAEFKIPAEADAHYYFLLGEMALSEERYEEATDYFEKASQIEKDPAPELRSRLAQLYVREGRLSEALKELSQALAGSPNDERLLRLKGGILASGGEREKAAEVYTELIALFPDNPDYYILLSSILAQDRKYKRAQDVLKGLISKDSDSVFGHYYLARMYDADKEYEGADTHYQKAIKLNPAAESITLDYARSLAIRSLPELAIKVCREFLKLNPRSVATRQLVGQLLWEGKKLGEALSELEELRDLEEDAGDTRLKIALIKLEQRDFEGAEQELRLILAANPEHPTVRYFLASTLAANGKAKEALSSLAEIDESSKMFIEARTLAAYLWRQEKAPEKAVEEIQWALSSSKGDIKLLVLLSGIQREAGMTTRALETQKSIIELQPDVDRNYFVLGVLYDELKQRSDAIAAMRKAIELNPNNANALNYLGYSLTENGGPYDEAQELIERALQIEPENGYFIDSLGWVLYRKGAKEQALPHLKRAAELHPNDAVILEHYAEILISLGRDEEAKKVVERALKVAPDSEDEQVVERLEELQQKIGSN